MASEKKPSIYDDRGTIGSSSELDEYGVWVKIEPQDLSSASLKSPESPFPEMDTLSDIDMGSTELPDLDIPEDFGETAEASLDLDDFNPDALGDLDLPEEDAPSPGEEADNGEEEDFSEISLDDFLGNPDESVPEEEPEEEAFSPEIPDEDLPLPEEKAPADLSTQLLVKIADELSSIRTELSRLKQEFSVIRTEKPAPAAEDAPAHGFFDEEDDEKIALTGDELDNIINTADFTEEAGTDVAESLAGEDLLKEAEEDNSSDPFRDLSEDFPPGEELNLDTEALGPDEPAFTDDELSLPGETALADEPAFTDDELSLPGETALADEPAFTDDELSLPDEAALADEPAFTDDELSLPDEAALADEPAFTDDELSLPGETALADEPALTEFNEEDFIFPGDDDAEEIIVQNDSEELQRIREEGALPITAAPENTGYLEEDPLAAMDDFDGNALDTAGAGPEEAELPADGQEQPPEETADLSLDDVSLDEVSLENPSIDLDLEEPAEDDGGTAEAETDAETETEETQEISLDDFLGAAEGGEPGEELIPEGFVVETEDTALPGDEDMAAAAAPDISGGEKEDNSVDFSELPGPLTNELRTVLSYMDRLLESLPEEKIEEFAKSEYFDTYKKLFRELGLG